MDEPPDGLHLPVAAVRQPRASAALSISGANRPDLRAGARRRGSHAAVQETASNAGGSSSPAESPDPAAVTAVVTVAPQTTASALTPVPPTSVVIAIRSLTVNRHGVASIPLVCPASAAGGCRGKITITYTEPRAKRARAARCGRGCRPLGTTNYDARAGQKVRVRVHIASFGRRVLTHHKSVRVTLTATSVSGAQTATVTRSIVLKSAA